MQIAGKDCFQIHETIVGGAMPGDKYNLLKVKEIDNYRDYFKEMANKDKVGDFQKYMQQAYKQFRSHFQTQTIRILSDAEYNAARSDFESKRSKLLSEWGSKISHQGVSIQNKDVHHLIPVILNGPNEWWNIIPLGEPSHYAAHEWMSQNFSN